MLLDHQTGTAATKFHGDRDNLRTPADPAVFVSEVLDWDVGDEFTASSLQKFRILEILPGIDEDAEFNAVWVVEPV